MTRSPFLLCGAVCLLLCPSALGQGRSEARPTEARPAEARSAADEGAAAEGEEAEPRPGRLRRSLRVVGQDYQALLQPRSLLWLGGGLAAGGAVANSDLDADLYADYRDWSGERDLSDWASVGKGMGEAEVVLPLFILPGLALGLDEEPGDRAVGRWWRRTARAYLVGAPTLYYLQQITGGGRPGDPEGSDWQPFEGNHGISGHAFLGAVPVLAAVRGSDRRWLQAGGIALSLLPAFARIEDGEHFPSQALLGWFLAWHVSGVVTRDRPARRYEVSPLASPDGTGLQLRLTLP